MTYPDWKWQRRRINQVISFKFQILVWGVTSEGEKNKTVTKMFNYVLFLTKVFPEALADVSLVHVEEDLGS